ncbi:uncharacterized protein N7443_007821 [Penicillium atrosanguineum]|uniref:uncharacterized protein n=1 Tax=Penicillium atrosanguineum TaxID=1132637 RepID=UPI002394BB66|nr:uncharacterized protein N7443_007821 [Penicillium atrosanguineum]KAJ5296928.1 hypothetical protein N7443_007821 [Penicillium atrosanguineum]
MTVLQALTLYTICGRFNAQGPEVKSLTRLAITIAFEIGLNDENLRINITPFEAEMRRRIWWQIFVLDTRIAEDDISEPCILESQFQNKFPSSISDADLDHDMSEIPKAQPGKSEMLFSLVRLETSYFTRLVLFSDQFTEKNSYPTISTSQEKCKAIDRFKERIELEYLSHCDTSIPLDFVTAESCRLIIAKLKLTVTKPQNRESQQVLTQESFRETCTEILKRAKEFRLHERSKRWLWIFQTYIEWDALTYLLISLSISPLGDGVDTAWTAAEEVFQYWDVISDSRGCSRWSRIVGFHTQALTAREMALSNPSVFRPSSNGDGQLEDSELIATNKPEPIPSADTMASLPLYPASQVIERLDSSVQPQGSFNRTSEDQSAEAAREPLGIPSSGTACQWSAALFEQYFDVLNSEQHDAPWF